MSSPAEIPFYSFIQIDKQNTSAIYMQITHSMIQAIQRGYLPIGIKLPGTRKLSELLNVHRKTIIAAFEELETQGWIEIHPNIGAFVVKKNNEQIKINLLETKLSNSYPQKTSFSFQTSNLLDNPYETPTCELFFNDGSPDVRLSPIPILSKQYGANLSRKQNHTKISRLYHNGSLYFRKQLSYYLNLSRGLHISEQNLLTTRSSEMSIYLISKVLLQKSDIVLVGELSYFKVNMIFQQTGAVLKTIPIDEHGILVDEVEKMCLVHPIRMLYLTPHHHYPTTTTLSANRRLQLLQLSKKYGFIILEDDYDFEFNYEKNNILPIATADTDGLVVYTGSFGKSLLPGFKTGFVVAPKPLIDELRKHLLIIDHYGDLLIKQVLGELIEEGEIHRHLKKSVKIYAQRRDFTIKKLNDLFGDTIQLTVPSGGLAVWVEWKKKINLMQVAKICLKNQLFIPKNILYQNRKITAMRIGFGHLTESEMEKCLHILAKAIDKLT